MPDDEKIIFIGGSGRCGTTLMAQLLDFHLEVASLFEVPMLLTMLNLWKKQQPLSDKFIEKLHQEASICMDPLSLYNWRMQPDELQFSINQFIKRLSIGHAPPNIIRAWITNVHMVQMVRDGAVRIVHKTPALSLFLEEIFQLWPQAFFVHMLRDPIGVIASYLDQSFGPTTVSDGVEWYCQRVGNAFRQGRRHSNYMEIKLEELANNPSETLDRLQKFVGLAPSTAVMLQNMNIREKEVKKRKSELDYQTQAFIFAEVCKKVPEISEIYDPPTP